MSVSGSGAEAAVVSRLAVLLAQHVTNSFIDRLGAQIGFPHINASNKVDKIQLVVVGLLQAEASRPKAGTVLVTLAGEAQHRTVAGKASLTLDELKDFEADVRRLGFRLGDAETTEWRRGLKPRATAAASPTSTARQGSPPPRGPTSSPPQPSSTPGTQPRHHAEGLRYFMELAGAESRPQLRGIELEKILTDVLVKEGLQAQHNVINPGEQIDVAFVLDAQHYLVECRWKREPQGLPALREFADKVRRKAEGTFGVFLSMSGFTANINVEANMGTRLNCVGLTSRELLAVLEGRMTFGAAVRKARTAASRSAEFYSVDR